MSQNGTFSTFGAQKIRVEKTSFGHRSLKNGVGLTTEGSFYSDRNPSVRIARRLEDFRRHWKAAVAASGRAVPLEKCR